MEAEGLYCQIQAPEGHFCIAPVWHRKHINETSFVTPICKQKVLNLEWHLHIRSNLQTLHKKFWTFFAGGKEATLPSPFPDDTQHHKLLHATPS